MALTNALLVRYGNKGFIEVNDGGSIAAHGRREGFLSVEAASTEEATRVAQAVLAGQATPHVATTAVLAPTGTGDAPYVDWTVGDHVNVPDDTGATASRRIIGLTVGEDEEGNPTFTPLIEALSDEVELNLQRAIKRMANGTLAGASSSASPVRLPTPILASPTTADPAASAGSSSYIPFTNGDSVTAPVIAETPSYEMRTATASLGIWVALLKTAGSTNTTIQVKRNGTVIGTFTLGSGVTRVTLDLTGYSGAVGDLFTANWTGVGTNAKGSSVMAPIA